MEGTGTMRFCDLKFWPQVWKEGVFYVRGLSLAARVRPSKNGTDFVERKGPSINYKYDIHMIYIYIWQLFKSPVFTFKSWGLHNSHIDVLFLFIL